MARARRAGQRTAHLVAWLRDVPPWPRLAALCIGLNLVETGLVMGFDPDARPDLAPQASAIAPFGVFGDLRWISVYQYSWWALAAELGAMLAVRGAVTALSISLAWPERVARPSLPRLVFRSVFGTALAAVLLVPSVALLFGLAAVPISWLFLAAVPLALLVALITHPAAVSGDWWRRLFSLRALGWVVLAFAVLSASSATMSAAPRPLWPVVGALSGLFNAWSWFGVVHAVADREPARHKVPVAALSVAALAAIVVGGTVLGFDSAKKSATSPFEPLATAPSAYEPTGPAVLLVSGYGSSWDGTSRHPIPGDFIEEPFSYRGLTASGAPLPYKGTDTAKPLGQLDQMLLQQVAALHEATGQSVDIVAESEGALIAKSALLAKPDPYVSVLVMASPLVSPGRVWYPTKGSKGWGVASSTAMKLIGDAFQSVSPVDLSPDNPLLASLDSQAPLLREAMACPLPGARQFALLPLADATATPTTYKFSYPSVVVAAFHGGLIETPAAARLVSQVLSNGRVGHDQVLSLAEKAISYAASAWQVPPLGPSEYPKAASSKPSLSCKQVARVLRSNLGH